LTANSGTKWLANVQLEIGCCDFGLQGGITAPPDNRPLMLGPSENGKASRYESLTKTKKNNLTRTDQQADSSGQSCANEILRRHYSPRLATPRFDPQEPEPEAR